MRSLISSAGFFVHACMYMLLLISSQLCVCMRSLQVAFIDCRDIGEAGGVALAEGTDKHGGKAYTLTGPKAYTMQEAAALLTGSLGREVKYVVCCRHTRALSVFA